MSTPRQRIVVTVRPDGTVEARTEGIHGEECVDRIATLEALLDAVTVDSQFTDDYRKASGHLQHTSYEVAEDVVRNEP